MSIVDNKKWLNYRADARRQGKSWAKRFAGGFELEDGVPLTKSLNFGLNLTQAQKEILWTVALGNAGFEGLISGVLEGGVETNDLNELRELGLIAPNYKDRRYVITEYGRENLDNLDPQT